MLQLGDSTATVLAWIINLITGAQILNYFFMLITFLGFFYACKAQGLDRKAFIYTSWFQPYMAYFALVIIGLMVGVLGYTVFMPGSWSTENFLTYCLMVLLDVVIFIAYKLIKRTKRVKSTEADLVTGLIEIEMHEEAYLESLAQEGKSRNSTRQKITDWIF